MVEKRTFKGVKMTTAKWTINTGARQAGFTLSCCKIEWKGVFASVGGGDAVIEHKNAHGT
jgi:hypothetical protein